MTNTSEQIEKQLRQNAEMLLNPAYRSGQIPDAVIAGSLQVAADEIARIRSSKTLNWKKRFLLHFIIYSVDITMAMLGFILAFGLTVKSWLWLIVLPFITRYVFHVINMILMMPDKEEK